jgi:hypothetical protein
LIRTTAAKRALTVRLIGLLAEETVISQRLGRLGKKKGSAVLVAAAPPE